MVKEQLERLFNHESEIFIRTSDGKTISFFEASARDKAAALTEWIAKWQAKEAT